MLSPDRSPAPRHRALAAATIAAVALGLAAAPRVARADDRTDEREALRVELNLFVIAVIYSEEDGLEAANFDAPPARCDEVVAGLRRLGLKPDDIMDGREPYPFRQAQDRCREYQRWRAFVLAAREVAPYAPELALVSSYQVGDFLLDEHIGKATAAHATVCAAAVDRALAAGASATLKIVVTYDQAAMTLPEARARICQALADWAAAFGPAHLAAVQATRKAARERYARFGAAGDRLDRLVASDPQGRGASWTIPGCKEESDPKKLVKAPVLISEWENPDGTIELKRLQFKGNKLVKSSSRAFFNHSYAMASGCK